MDRLPSHLKAALTKSCRSQNWNKRCLHLATVGSPDLQLQIWLDPTNACVLYRSVVNKEQKNKLYLCHK